MRFEEDYNLFTRLSDLHQKIAGDINKRKYDLVIVSHDRFIQTPFLSQYLKSKTLYYCQEPWRSYYEYTLNPLNYKNNSIKKILLSLSDYRRKLADCSNARCMNKILVNSDSSMESVYRAYGIYASVCHLGVDTAVFRPLKIKKENYIYSVGNLSIHKGHEFVIDSLSLLKGKDKPALYISSGGINLERKDYLEKYAVERGIKLKIISRVSEEDIVRLYNKAKIVICAAHLETLGLSAIEAMACGTPVIAIKEGGYRDMVIDGVNGLFAERDERSLANAIKLLLSDRLLYSKIAKQSRKSIYPYWTWDAATKRLEKYIDRVIE
jgi:glycosyltransferase involved in cell wall biosynthesis